MRLSKLYDHDENGKLNRVELLSMLESVGSTLSETSMSDIFSRYQVEEEAELPIEQVAVALEDLSISSMPRKEFRFLSRKKAMDLESSFKHSKSISLGDYPFNRPDSPASDSGTSSNNAENVVCLKECPICFKPWARKHSDVDIITHLAICTSIDSSSMDRIVMGGFLTEEYASRKWYSKVLFYLGYGGYSIGKNNGNIFVQDRVLGKLVEEKIPMNIRIGIRLIYQNLASNKSKNILIFIFYSYFIHIYF